MSGNAKRDELRHRSVVCLTCAGVQLVAYFIVFCGMFGHVVWRVWLGGWMWLLLLWTPALVASLLACFAQSVTVRTASAFVMLTEAMLIPVVATFLLTHLSWIITLIPCAFLALAAVDVMRGVVMTLPVGTDEDETADED